MRHATKAATWKMPLGTSPAPQLDGVTPHSQARPYGDDSSHPVEAGAESIHRTASKGGAALPPVDRPTVDWHITSMDEGQLNGNEPVLRRIRRYANRVVKGDDWPLDALDLAKVTFEVRPRAKRRHGVAEYHRNGHTTIGISEHSLKHGDEDGLRELIRHELIHAWQNQHFGTTVELPNGETVENVSRGHTGNWYTWEALMDVQRTQDLYDTPPEQYKYVLGCAECSYWEGRYRLCKSVQQAVRGELSCASCGGDMRIVPPDGCVPDGYEDLPDHVIRDFYSWD